MQIMKSNSFFLLHGWFFICNQLYKFNNQQRIRKNLFNILCCSKVNKRKGQNYSSADGNSSILVDPGEERADPGVGLGISGLTALGSKGHDADLLPDTVHDGQRTTAVTLPSAHKLLKNVG